MQVHQHLQSCSGKVLFIAWWKVQPWCRKLMLWCSSSLLSHRCFQGRGISRLRKSLHLHVCLDFLLAMLTCSFSHGVFRNAVWGQQGSSLNQYKSWKCFPTNPDFMSCDVHFPECDFPFLLLSREKCLQPFSAVSNLFSSPILNYPEKVSSFSVFQLVLLIISGLCRRFWIISPFSHLHQWSADFWKPSSLLLWFLV